MVGKEPVKVKERVASGSQVKTVYQRGRGSDELSELLRG